MILPTGTIVAVVDGEKLRMFRNKGHEPRIELVPLPAPDIEPVKGGSGVRHINKASNPDSDRLDEDAFAAAAAEYLNGQAIKGAFEKLYLVADPRTLGEMRRNFHNALEQRLVGTLDRDLAGLSLEAIAEAILAAR